MATFLHRRKAPSAYLVVAGIAVLAVAAFNRFGAGEERLFAMNAYGVHDTAPHLALHDESLVVADPSGTPSITALAGRHEIGDIVVSPVAVNMVNYERTLVMTDTWHPVHGGLAPVTRMWPHADGVEQDESVFRHKSTVSRQEVPRSYEHLSAFEIASALVPARVGTLLCTKGPREGGWPCVLFSTVVAGACDWHTPTVPTPHAEGKSLCKGYS